MAILSVTLTGCSNGNNVSDKNNNIIADYMASLVLKYDRSYDDKLMDPTVIASAASHSAEVNEENHASKKSEDTSKTNKTEDDKKITDSTKVSVETAEYEELNKVMGYDKFNIEYENYKLYNSFPNGKAKDYFTLEAGKNKKLCVVQFNIENKTSKDKKFNLLNKEIKYQLVTDTRSYKPLITLLVNDLQFIDVNIKSGKSRTGYLVFEIPKDIKIENGKLIASKNSDQSLIVLK